MELQGKRIAILVDNVYREAGAQVVTVGATKGAIYTSNLGYPATCDLSYDEARAAPDHMRRHAKCLSLVAEMNRQGKLISAICHAGLGPLLGAWHATRGRHGERRSHLRGFRKPDDLPGFCRACIQILAHAPVHA